jgi:hypothetical protein
LRNDTDQGAIIMKQIQERPPTTAPQPDRSMVGGGRVSSQITVWQLNLLRVGYLVMGGGLAVVKWPLLFEHKTWGLAEGTVQCMLVAMSVLALLGIRYPARMLPVLLFEVAWKLLWLGVIALPLWSQNKLEGATLARAVEIGWVVIIMAVIPWRQVLAQYVAAPGEAWRRPRKELLP